MYNFFFETRIGYFVVLFLLSEILNLGIYSLLSIVSELSFVTMFESATIASFFMAIILTSTKKI